MTEKQKTHIKRQLEKRVSKDEIYKVSLDLTEQEYEELLKLMTGEEE